jgi:hypothetical protein
VGYRRYSFYLETDTVAAIAIPLIIIVLAAVGYLLWSLFAAGRGVAGIAGALREDHSGETAPHSDEHTKTRQVETKPPE